MWESADSEMTTGIENCSATIHETKRKETCCNTGVASGCKTEQHASPCSLLGEHDREGGKGRLSECIPFV